MLFPFRFADTITMNHYGKKTYLMEAYGSLFNGSLFNRAEERVMDRACHLPSNNLLTGDAEDWTWWTSAIQAGAQPRNH